MFLSSFRRPPSSNNRTGVSRNVPTATVSGTSITRPRGLKPAEAKPVAIARAYPSLTTPVLSDQSRPIAKREP